MARKNSSLNKGRFISAKRRSMIDRPMATEESPYKEVRRANSQLGDYATINAEKRKNSLMALRIERSMERSLNR